MASAMCEETCCRVDRKTFVPRKAFADLSESCAGADAAQSTTLVPTHLTRMTFSARHTTGGGTSTTKPTIGGPTAAVLLGATGRIIRTPPPLRIRQQPAPTTSQAATSRTSRSSSTSTEGNEGSASHRTPPPPPRAPLKKAKRSCIRRTPGFLVQETSGI